MPVSSAPLQPLPQDMLMNSVARMLMCCSSAVNACSALCLAGSRIVLCLVLLVASVHSVLNYWRCIIVGVVS